MGMYGELPRVLDWIWQTMFKITFFIFNNLDMNKDDILHNT